MGRYFILGLVGLLAAVVTACGEREAAPTSAPSAIPAPAAADASGAPALVSYGAGREQGRALLCRPQGRGPFPTVVYNHGQIVDERGYQGASERGYNLDRICQALAQDGLLAFLPLRQSGRGPIPRHKEEVSRAIDHVRSRPDVDPSRVAVMGFSRGGLLTLMVGVEGADMKALLILAPAPGRGHFAEAVRRTASIRAPVLLLVAAKDDPEVLQGFALLERALREQGKEVRALRYDRGDGGTPRNLRFRGDPDGHRLFWDVGYWWDDVAAFLREKLGAQRRESP